VKILECDICGKRIKEDEPYAVLNYRTGICCLGDYSIQTQDNKVLNYDICINCRGNLFKVIESCVKKL